MRPLVIRADASESIGTGHIMRMIALAQAYRWRGGRVVFASVQCPQCLIDRVCELGFEHKLLGGKSLGDESDSSLTFKLCKDLSAGWVVLDNYHFDESYQKRVSGAGIRVLAVDDFGHCSTWHCDAVLNQNLGAAQWGRPQTTHPDTQLLLGSSFALLREEFMESILSSNAKGIVARRVLVTLGGADPGNATLQVLQALEDTTLDGLAVRVLVGGANTHYEALRVFASKSKFSIEVMCDVRDMPSMYQWADAVISAGGSTCWEWLAYGLSGAVVTIADNQEPVVAALGEECLALPLGKAAPCKLGVWSEKLDSWLRGRNRGASFNERRKVIDGYGAARVAALLANDGLWCRLATSEDSRLYFDWANDPQVRSNSFHSSNLIWESHCIWFEKIVSDPAARLYVVGNVMGSMVGQVRLTSDLFGYVEIGFSVDEKFRGSGMGEKIVKHVLNQDSKRRSHFKGYLARVKISNKPSSRIFLKLGFREFCQDSSSGSYVYIKNNYF